VVVAGSFNEIGKDENEDTLTEFHAPGVMTLAKGERTQEGGKPRSRY
jgi:hypothetical protein